MGTEEEVTSGTPGARACWQNSEGWTGALSREKGQKAFQKEGLVRPQWGHGAWRIATVLSDTGDLRLCSRKFIMRSLNKRGPPFETPCKRWGRGKLLGDWKLGEHTWRSLPVCVP